VYPFTCGDMSRPDELAIIGGGNGDGGNDAMDVSAPGAAAAKFDGYTVVSKIPLNTKKRKAADGGGDKKVGKGPPRKKKKIAEKATVSKKTEEKPAAAATAIAVAPNDAMDEANSDNEDDEDNESDSEEEDPNKADNIKHQFTDEERTAIEKGVREYAEEEARELTEVQVRELVEEEMQRVTIERDVRERAKEEARTLTEDEVQELVEEEMQKAARKKLLIGLAGEKDEDASDSVDGDSEEEYGDEVVDGPDNQLIHEQLIDDISARVISTSVVDFEQVHQFLAQLNRSSKGIHADMSKLKNGFLSSHGESGFYLSGGKKRQPISRLLVTVNLAKLNYIHGLTPTKDSTTSVLLAGEGGGFIDAGRLNYDPIIGNLNAVDAGNAAGSIPPPFMISMADRPSAINIKRERPCHRLYVIDNKVQEGAVGVTIQIDRQMEELLATGYPIIYYRDNLELLLFEMPVFMFVDFLGSSAGFIETIILPRYLEDELVIRPNSGATLSSCMKKLRKATKKSKSTLTNFTSAIKILRTTFERIAHRLDYSSCNFFTADGRLLRSEYVFIVVRFLPKDSLDELEVRGLPPSAIAAELALIKEYHKHGESHEQNIYVGDFPFNDNEPPFDYVPQVFLRPFFPPNDAVAPIIAAAATTTTRNPASEKEATRKAARVQSNTADTKYEAERRHGLIGAGRDVRPLRVKELERLRAQWKVSEAKLDLRTKHSKMKSNGVEEISHSRVKRMVPRMAELEAKMRPLDAPALAREMVGKFEIAKYFERKKKEEGAAEEDDEEEEDTTPAPDPQSVCESIIASRAVLSELRSRVANMALSIDIDQLDAMYLQLYFHHIRNLRQRLVTASYTQMNDIINTIDIKLRDAPIPVGAIEKNLAKLERMRESAMASIGRNPWHVLSPEAVSAVWRAKFQKLGAFGATQTPEEAAAKKEEARLAEAQKIAEDKANAHASEDVISAVKNPANFPLQHNPEKSWAVSAADYHKLLSGYSANLTTVVGTPAPPPKMTTLEKMNYVEAPSKVPIMEPVLPYKIFIMPTAEFINTMLNPPEVKQDFKEELKRDLKGRIKRDVNDVGPGAAQVAVPLDEGNDDDDAEAEEVVVAADVYIDLLNMPSKLKPKLKELVDRFAQQEQAAKRLASHFDLNGTDVGLDIASGDSNSYKDAYLQVLVRVKRQFDVDSDQLEKDIERFLSSYRFPQVVNQALKKLLRTDKERDDVYSIVAENPDISALEEMEEETERKAAEALVSSDEQESGESNTPDVMDVDTAGTSGEVVAIEDDASLANSVKTYEVLLEQMTKSIEEKKLHDRVQSLASNITAVSEWMNTLRSKPLKKAKCSLQSLVFDYVVKYFNSTRNNLVSELSNYLGDISAIGLALVDIQERSSSNENESAEEGSSPNEDVDVQEDSSSSEKKDTEEHISPNEKEAKRVNAKVDSAVEKIQVWIDVLGVRLSLSLPEVELAKEASERLQLHLGADIDELKAIGASVGSPPPKLETPRRIVWNQKIRLCVAKRKVSARINYMRNLINTVQGLTKRIVLSPQWDKISALFDTWTELTKEALGESAADIAKGEGIVAQRCADPTFIDTLIGQVKSGNTKIQATGPVSALVYDGVHGSYLAATFIADKLRQFANKDKFNAYLIVMKECRELLSQQEEKLKSVDA
jgi:hypothetical protein